MLTKMLFSDNVLGVFGEDDKNLKIFIALIYAPAAILGDILLLPLEIISIIIGKIIYRK